MILYVEFHYKKHLKVCNIILPKELRISIISYAYFLNWMDEFNINYFISLIEKLNMAVWHIFFCHCCEFHCNNYVFWYCALCKIEGYQTEIIMDSAKPSNSTSKKSVIATRSADDSLNNIPLSWKSCASDYWSQITFEKTGFASFFLWYAQSRRETGFHSEWQIGGEGNFCFLG